MARRLKVNVRMDRLPNVTGGPKNGWAQFGICLSAAIEPDGNDGAVDGDRKLVGPWWWRDAAALGSAWNPHDAASWRIWRVHNGTAERLDDWEIASASSAMLDAVVPGLGPAPPFGRLRMRIEEEIDLCLSSGGARTMEAPPPGAAVSSRTVFGLVETLSSLPHPVPSNLKVWASVQTGTAITDDASYVAVPVFANEGGDRYQTWDTAHPENGADPLKPVWVADGQWSFAYPGETTATRSGWANLSSSFPLSLMQIGPDDPQRLIDLSTLLVRKGSGPQIEGLDWSSDLVSRIAETIDPSLRAASVLEAVLSSIAAKAQDVVDAPDPTRAALRNDLAHGGADHFRQALTNLELLPLAHRARGSRGAPAPALGFLEGLAMLDRNLWSAAATLMFAHAGAETHASPPAAPAASVVGRRRVAQAAGLDPKTDLGEEVLREPPDLGAADALQAWLTAHWTQMPQAQPAPDGAGRRVFRQTLDRLIVRPGASVQRRVDSLGILDLGRLRGSQDQTLDLVFSVKALVAGSATVALAPPSNPRAARLEVVLSLAAGGVSLEAGGLKEGPVPFADGELRISVKATPAGLFTATVTYGSPGAPLLQVSPFDIAAVAAAGLLGLETVTPAPAVLELIKSGEIPSAAVQQLAAGRPWRTRMAVAYYGAEASGLIAGWLEGKPVDRAWFKEDLRTTLISAIKAYVPPAFDAAFAAAMPPAIDASLEALLNAVRDRAKDDAIERAKSLVPQARDDRNVRTAKAMPLTFVFDQLQDFEEGVDLWSRLAGLGVLIRRTDAGSDGNADEWWSLNRATLHAPRISSDGVRPPLAADNAVAVDGGTNQWDVHWRERSRVDPAPFVVGEVNGSRSAVLPYESQPIVGELQGALKMKSGAGRYVPRRLEAYYFPTSGFGAMRLPALTFGRSYQVMPYLIGLGGVLPPALRSVPEKPNSGPMSWSESGETLRVARAPIKDSIREAKYKRTSPIGPPGLVEAGTTWPSAPVSVETLRGQLPPRMPPVTLPDGVPTRFFDARGAGLLTPPPVGGAGATAVATVRFPAVTAPAGARLRLRAVGAETVYLDVEFDAPASGGVEVEVSGAVVSAQAIAWPATAVAEDEPNPGAPILVTTTTVQPVASWLRTALEVTVTGGAQMEPPMVWWGARDAGVYSRIGDRPELPLDATAPPDKLALLDGIPWGAPSARTARLRISRPTTTCDNFDRWLNGPLTGFGAAALADIRTVLKSAEKVASDPNAREQIPEPAVEALVMEVVRLYPTRRIEIEPVLVQPVLEKQRWDRIPAPGDLSKSARDIDVAVDVSANYATRARWQNNQLKVSPGCVYELRFYGAAPASQPQYAPAAMTVRERFCSAAAASIREEVVGTDRWLLGSPLVMSLEVASAALPKFGLELSPPPFRIELPAPAAPDAVMPLAARSARTRPAIVRLAPENIDAGATTVARYAALRAVSKVVLVEQPWDWRGVPPPVLAANASGFGDQGKVSREVKEFSDAAHIWRDELDRLAETPAGLTKAQVYGGRTVFDPAQLSDKVQLLRRNLPHGVGARLWRFGVRASSRYAPMRPGDLRLQVTSHKPPGGGLNWWPLVARDRLEAASPRTPQRPGLMLVLPLTEPMSGDGAVPPLLALFNDKLFPGGNIADGVEAVIEVARHPLTATEMMDMTHAPGFDAAVAQVKAGRADVAEKRALLAKALDFKRPASPADQMAARTALEAAQTALGVRETAFAAIYAAGSAWGALKRWQAIQTQTQTDQQAAQRAYNNEADPAKKQAFKHDLDKLNERVVIVAQRVADAQAIANAPPSTPYAGRIMDVAAKYYQEWAPDAVRTADSSGGDPIALRVDGPVGYTLDKPGQAGSYAHAGLLVSPVGDQLRPWSMIKLKFRRLEAPELLEAPEETLNDQWSPRPLDGAWAFSVPTLTGALEALFSFETNPATSQVKLQVSHAAGRLAVEMSTGLGVLRTWSIEAGPDRTVEVRVVVSERSRPQGKKYAPSADVSLQVRITPPAVDGTQVDREGVWLSIACLPLTSIEQIDPELAPTLRTKMSQAGLVKTRRVRASDFTPGVWCQFATAMSLFEVRGVVGTGAAAQDVSAVVPVERLVVTPASGGASLQLGVKDQALKKIGLAAVGAPDPNSQFEEQIFAIATQYAYDALDRLRERAVAIFEVKSDPADPILGRPVWPSDGVMPFASGSGRVRLLHVLRGRLKADGGFEDALRSFPSHFFGPGSEGDPEFPDDPPDAAGQILGISRPIEWRAL